METYLKLPRIYITPLYPKSPKEDQEEAILDFVTGCDLFASLSTGRANRCFTPVFHSFLTTFGNI